MKRTLLLLTLFCMPVTHAQLNITIDGGNASALPIAVVDFCQSRNAFGHRHG